MLRRVILIEHPPKIWIEAGLFYVDFQMHTNNVIAFQPNAWLATGAIGQRATSEWQHHVADIARLERSG